MFGPTNPYVACVPSLEVSAPFRPFMLATQVLDPLGFRADAAVQHAIAALLRYLNTLDFSGTLSHAGQIVHRSLHKLNN